MTNKSITRQGLCDLFDIKSLEPYVHKKSPSRRSRTSVQLMKMDNSSWLMYVLNQQKQLKMGGVWEARDKDICITLQKDEANADLFRPVQAISFGNTYIESVDPKFVTLSFRAAVECVKDITKLNKRNFDKERFSNLKRELGVGAEQLKTFPMLGVFRR